MRPLGEATGYQNYNGSEHVADHVVLKATGFLGVCSFVKCRRLKYLRRLLRSDQLMLLKFLAVAGIRQRTWLQTIRNDFCWLHDLFPHKFENLGHPHENFKGWIELVHSSPS